MIEPEMAFYEIEDNMDLAEDFIKSLVQYALDNCADDLQFLNNMYDNELIERLKGVVNTKFVRLPYTEGVKILKESGAKFEYPVDRSPYQHIHVWLHCLHLTVIFHIPVLFLLIHLPLLLDS